MGLGMRLMQGLIQGGGANQPLLVVVVVVKFYFNRTAVSTKSLWVYIQALLACITK